ADTQFMDEPYDHRLLRVTLSSSRNAVSISSACTTKRFPSPRCASAIQIVRPSESTAETQPQLQLCLVQLLHHRRKNELSKPAGLLQRDFAHELGARDLANIEAFH